MSGNDWYALLPERQWLRDDERCHADALEIWNNFHLHKGMSVFDCPCGRGQMSKPLARLGARVCGMDLNRHFIEEATASFAAEGLNAVFSVGDMREASYEGGCDLLLNWFNSFGYFADEKDDMGTMRRFADCLKPGGVLVMENPNPRDILNNIESKQDDAAPVKPFWDAANKRLHGYMSGLDCSIRIYSHQEYEEMFRKAGLIPAGLWGEHFTPFSEISRRMIMAARKPE